MIYKVTKHVFNSFGKEVETLHFNVPSSFVNELVSLLISEGYTVFENDDYYKMLSALHDNCTYTRYTFRLVKHG